MSLAIGWSWGMLPYMAADQHNGRVIGQAACMHAIIDSPRPAPTSWMCRQFEQMEVDGLLKKKRGKDCYQACSGASCLQHKELCCVCIGGVRHHHLSGHKSL